MKFEKIILTLLILLSSPLILVFWRPLVLGIIVSIWGYPLISKLNSKTSINFNKVLVILNIIVGILIVTGVSVCIYIITQQINELMDFLRQTNFNVNNFKGIPYVGKYLYHYVSKINITQLLDNYLQVTVNKTLTIGYNIMYFALYTYIFTVWTNIILMSKKHYLNDYLAPIYKVYPSLKHIGLTIYKTVQQIGITLITNAMITSLIMGVVYYSVGLRFIAFLMLLTFVAATIPTGVIILLLTLGTVTALSMSISQAIIILAIGFTVNIIMDQVLQPTLLKKFGANFNLAMSLIGILGGIICFGLIGIIIGPVLVAISTESFKLLIGYLIKNNSVTDK